MAVAFNCWILHLIVDFTFNVHLIARPPYDRNGQTIREMSALSLFVITMAMISIFYFAKFRLLEKKLGRLENSKNIFDFFLKIFPTSKIRIFGFSKIFGFLKIFVFFEKIENIFSNFPNGLTFFLVNQI